MAIIIKSGATKLDDSYVTVEEADDYFNNFLSTEIWERADTNLKQKALKTATSQIDSLEFVGYKFNPNQPLAFPRIKRLLSDMERIKYQNCVPEVPQDVKRAVLEQALWLIQQKTSNQNEYDTMQAHNIKSYTIGDVSISFDLERYSKSQSLCANARQLLNKYLIRFTKLI